MRKFYAKVGFDSTLGPLFTLQLMHKIFSYIAEETKDKVQQESAS
jgi:hypothetical protein